MFTTDDRFLIIDTETANTLDDPIVYDVGFAVIDIFGNTYWQGSYVINETFFDNELMSTAYFKDKIPAYLTDIESGNRALISFFALRRLITAIMRTFNINIVIAHNARFDIRSLNLTLRYLSNSTARYFFPYKTKVWDTLKMAQDLLTFNSEYINFCKTNNYLTTRKKIRFTAEILYRFIIQDTSFIESHTALQDVLIEKNIFAYCLKQDPELDGELWKKEEEIAA